MTATHTKKMAAKINGRETSPIALIKYHCPLISISHTGISSQENRNQVCISNRGVKAGHWLPRYWKAERGKRKR